MNDDATGARIEPTAPALPAAHTITQAALIEYLASRAVTELVLVETGTRIYRLEVALSWRSGRSVVVAARGAERRFRSLDTAAKFLRTVGIGSTLVRLELKP